jgi:hypothetical protein
MPWLDLKREDAMMFHYKENDERFWFSDRVGWSCFGDDEWEVVKEKAMRAAGKFKQ